MRIDQLVPAFHRGDAIGDTAFHIKNFLLKKGFQSEIYCLSRDEELKETSVLFDDFSPPGSSDITILHYALPSPLTDAFIMLSSKKILIYHNITPHHFFKDYSDEMTRISLVGREELIKLKTAVDLGLADSEFNRQELISLGIKKTAVFPLFIDFEKYKRPPNPFVERLFNDGRINILFVGRIVPNKRIDELIKVVFYFKKYISPLVRLIIVGKTSSLPSYYKCLVRLVDDFYLQPEEVCFTGHIPDEDMYAIYRRSHVFLSMSEHEGFGLPFMESMVFDLPIIAFSSTAVPYTLDGAGVILSEKKVDKIAELINIIACDENIRENIIQGQRERLKRFKEADLEAMIMKFIGELSEK